MAMRMSGLMSGMDTESVIQQLVEAKSTKVKAAKNSQTKLGWKQEIWKGLNSKLKTLQSKLNDLRFSSGYAKKVTKSSNEGIASVLTSDSAVNGVHALEVKRMAKTAYLTGGKVSRQDGLEIDITETQMSDLTRNASWSDGRITVTKEDGSKTNIQLSSTSTISDVLTELKKAGLNANFDAKQQRFFVSSKESGEAGNFMITGDDNLLGALGLGFNQTGSPISIQDGDGNWGFASGANRLDEILTFNDPDNDLIRLKVTTADGEEKMISLSAYTRDENGVRHFNTIDDLVTQLKDAGVNATFDRNEGFSLEPGAKISALEGDASSQKALEDLGLDYMRSANTGATFVRGQDAEITLNGATFTSTNNTFEINGLTITTQDVTEPGKSITLTTQQDTDGIYDMIKDFLKTYNEVINELDKVYNADSAKDYEPLSDEEKSTMSESEIEKYEGKIKDSLLRRDGSVSQISSALKNIMLSGFEVNGKKMYLASFGIETLNYFAAPDNERNAYHINGDKDDVHSSGNEDKLRSMIASDPDAVVSFFSQLSQSLYTEMNEQSASVEGYRSFGSFYDDKKMKTDYDDYKSKIKDLEKKLTAYEDKWYQKFAAMETAMAKMQQNASAVTSLLGGQ